VSILLPTALAAMFLEVTPSAIRHLGLRQHLTRHGSERYGLWDLDELTTWMESHPRLRRRADEWEDLAC